MLFDACCVLLFGVCGLLFVVGWLLFVFFLLQRVVVLCAPLVVTGCRYSLSLVVVCCSLIAVHVLFIDVC